MRPSHFICPKELYLLGHFFSRSASALPYPTCCFQYLFVELRLWCHTMAECEYAIRPPLSISLQHRSTSSPAVRNRESNPFTSISASFLKSMLHPGTCSALMSETRTGFGPPGACPIATIRQSSLGGGRFGPPTPTQFSSSESESTRYFSQRLSG